MVVCEQLLGEVRRGLDSAYFRGCLTTEERETSLAAIGRIGWRMADPVAPPRVVRDPDDDYLVALAKASTATAIVTGDRDLLDHEGLEPPAITARAACVRFGLGITLGKPVNVATGECRDHSARQCSVPSHVGASS